MSMTECCLLQKTATKAVVELPKNAHLGKYGFRLQVGLSQIHVPRMWVEKHPDRDSQVKIYVNDVTDKILIVYSGFWICNFAEHL